MTTTPHVVIIGGGLAGLSAGCYAQASGMRATIVEHNLALGGVCTAWKRGPYMIDGCIHWLTGGPFDQLYRELGIFPKVSTHTLDLFASYRDLGSDARIDITRDLDALCSTLQRISPVDSEEIARIVDGARSFADMRPALDAQELASPRQLVAQFWEMRHQLGAIAHFRKSLGSFTRERLRSPVLRRMFCRIAPPDAPALFLLMMLGYLERGYLSRPDGGTARFRDALVDSYHQLGGRERLHDTVDEVLVEGDRARGVRLADGTMIEADVVISTGSAPETVLRLLGGRYGANELRERMQTWKLFDPIVLASYGVKRPLTGVPPTLLIDGIAPLDVGGRNNEHLYVRIYNDDPSFAPPGHTVVQAMLGTDYEWWATRGSDYNATKGVVAASILTELERHIPDLRGAAETVDLATPLTYWHMARSWRGAFEGWMPSSDAAFSHVKKKLPGLSAFYMAGQWVEPGGGVPMALMSGRQVCQLVCADLERAFTLPSQASQPARG